MDKQTYQKGQILLIVVLVMVTALTIGLSVAARSITNTRMSVNESNSEKAFSAAEAGVEQSLTNSSAVSGSFTNNTSYKTVIQTVAGTQFSMDNGSPVLKDTPTDLWFSIYPNFTNQWSGTFNVYWGQSGNICSTSEQNNTTSALEILVLSGTKANPQMARYAFDPCASRQANNHFTFVNPGTYAIAGKNYLYTTPAITVANGFIARIIPLYAPAVIGIGNCGCHGGIPAQGTVIQSTGIADTTQREIVTYRYNPTLPSEIFQYGFFVPQ